MMLLEHLGWQEAADRILRSLAAAVAQKKVTYDLERQMRNATCVPTSGFAAAIVENM